MITMYKLLTLCYLFCHVKCTLENQCNKAEVRDLRTNVVVSTDVVCKNEPCIMRFCPRFDEILVIASGRSKPKCKNLEEINNGSGSIVLPSILYKKYDSSSKEVSDKNLLTDLHHVIYTDSSIISENCSNKALIEGGNRKIIILEDGSAIYWDMKDEQHSFKVPRGDFIMEFIVRDKGRPLKILKLLKDKTAASNGDTDYFFRVIGFAISSFLLILVLVVYLLTMTRSLGTLMFMAHLGCLALGFALKAIQLIMLRQHKLDLKGCSIICSMWYFSFLASFFWMNVMAIDVFWIICGKYKSRDTNRRSLTCGIDNTDLRKFLMYGIHAMGMPLLITIFAVTVDLVPNNVKIKPYFRMCFPEDALIVYYYIPVGVILLLNILLVIITSIKIYWHRYMHSEMYKSKESRCTRKNNDKFFLYLKLTLVTGVNWLMDFIELIVDLPTTLVYIFNSNIFIGVVMFIIFVLCNKTVMKQIRQCKRHRGNSDPCLQSGTKSSSGGGSSKQTKESNISMKK